MNEIRSSKAISMNRTSNQRRQHYENEEKTTGKCNRNFETAHQKRYEWEKKTNHNHHNTICLLFIYSLHRCFAISKIVLLLLMFSFDIRFCSRFYSVQCTPHAANSIVFRYWILFGFEKTNFTVKFSRFIFFYRNR